MLPLPDDDEPEELLLLELEEELFELLLLEDDELELLLLLLLLPLNIFLKKLPVLPLPRLSLFDEEEVLNTLGPLVVEPPGVLGLE